MSIQVDDHYHSLARCTEEEMINRQLSFLLRLVVVIRFFFSSGFVQERVQEGATVGSQTTRRYLSEEEL